MRDGDDPIEREIELVGNAVAPKVHRWLSRTPTIAGGAVTADALGAFDAAVAGMDVDIIIVPVPERSHVVIYRKLLTKWLQREDYGLDDEIYLAAGMVVQARNLLVDSQ
jgi:hypothetical protein